MKIRAQKLPSFHKTLRVTPAMEAGLTDHVWTLEELCALLPERKPNEKFEKELTNRKGATTRLKEIHVEG